MKKLLLVDDADILIKSYANHLENVYGINNIRTAWNGKDALEKILEDKPDVILTDIDMPVMDGYELCKKIRENPNLSDIYIIVSGGGNLPKEIGDYVDEIIPKGKTQEILRRLAELLEGKEK